MDCDDYEPCAMCGYDHEYETDQANKSHMAEIENDLQTLLTLINEEGRLESSVASSSKLAPLVIKPLIRGFLSVVRERNVKKLQTKIDGNKDEIMKDCDLYHVFDSHGLI